MVRTPWCFKTSSSSEKSFVLTIFLHVPFVSGFKFFSDPRALTHVISSCCCCSLFFLWHLVFYPCSSQCCSLKEDLLKGVGRSRIPHQFEERPTRVSAVGKVNAEVGKTGTQSALIHVHMNAVPYNPAEFVILRFPFSDWDLQRRCEKMSAETTKSGKRVMSLRAQIVV